MYDAVADDGLLSCVPLTVDDDVAPAGDSRNPETLCWREGIQFIEGRLFILKLARIHNISLISLSQHLGVRWAHFLEWAAWAEEDVCWIFTDHRWYDEITSSEPQFAELRRHGLAVGDYFASM
jgi:hypothetical protein